MLRVKLVMDPVRIIVMQMCKHAPDVVRPFACDIVCARIYIKYSICCVVSESVHEFPLATVT